MFWVRAPLGRLSCRPNTATASGGRPGGRGCGRDAPRIAGERDEFAMALRLTADWRPATGCLFADAVGALEGPTAAAVDLLNHA